MVIIGDSNAKIGHKTATRFSRNNNRENGHGEVRMAQLRMKLTTNSLRIDIPVPMYQFLAVLIPENGHRIVRAILNINMLEKKKANR